MVFRASIEKNSYKANWVKGKNFIPNKEKNPI